jgi:hypothetical protein
MLSITSRSAHAFIGRSVAEGEDPLPFLHSITDDLFAHFGRKVLSTNAALCTRD